MTFFCVVSLVFSGVLWCSFVFSGVQEKSLKPRLAAVAEIKRLKRKVSQLETIRQNDEGAARMVQLFEKKYSDERNRNSILRCVPAFLSVAGNLSGYWSGYLSG